MSFLFGLVSRLVRYLHQNWKNKTDLPLFLLLPSMFFNQWAGFHFVSDVDEMRFPVRKWRKLNTFWTSVTIQPLTAGLAPQYISNLLPQYVPSCVLRSSTKPMRWTFSVRAHTLWHNLPEEILLANSSTGICSFKPLFMTCYWCAFLEFWSYRLLTLF